MSSVIVNGLFHAYKMQWKIITTRECCHGEISIQNGDSTVQVTSDYVALRKTTGTNQSDKDTNDIKTNSIADEFCSITIPGMRFIPLWTSESEALHVFLANILPDIIPLEKVDVEIISQKMKSTTIHYIRVLPRYQILQATVGLLLVIKIPRKHALSKSNLAMIFLNNPMTRMNWVRTV